MLWDPQQYNRFKEQRMEPFRDLVRWLRVRPGMVGVDLGCGTGELTRQLAELLPECSLLGVDRSAEMLSQAQEAPGLQFRRCPIESLEGSFDLIFSHAALQWVEGHPQIFTRLWSHLKPGGQLLVQMPANFDHFSHRCAAAIFEREFAGKARRFPVLKPEQYAEHFYSLGCRDFEVILKVYPHVLESAEAIVEWTKGTLLTAYLPQLSKPDQERFLEFYAREMAGHFPNSPVFYGFKRLLIYACKSS